MNFSQAKQIPIADYLTGRGIQPQRRKGNDLWYCSPLRSEQTPSFKVDTARNIWYDHGTGAGGTIIDLVQTLLGVDAIGALHLLSNDLVMVATVEDNANYKQPPKTSGQAEDGVKIKSVKLLSNPVLIKYLESRGIPFQIGRSYLRECYYSVGSRDFFTLGFENDAGGYELRNSLWKGASSPKAITTQQTGDRGTIAVFEGFMDMLSALAHFGKVKPAHSWLVLNSVSLLDTALPALSQYERIHVFLDNDHAGQKAVEAIRAVCPSVIDYAASIYPQHKDFNDFLISKTT